MSECVCERERERERVCVCVCRDGEPRTATSTSTQLLSSDPSSVSVLPCIREGGRPAEHAIFGVCGPVSHGLWAAYDRPRRQMKA